MATATRTDTIDGRRVTLAVDGLPEDGEIESSIVAARTAARILTRFWPSETHASREEAAGGFAEVLLEDEYTLVGFARGEGGGVHDHLSVAWVRNPGDANPAHVGDPGVWTFLCLTLECYSY